MHNYDSSFFTRPHKKDGRNQRAETLNVSASSQGVVHQATPYTTSESSVLVHGSNARKYSPSIRATASTRNLVHGKDRATAAQTKEGNPTSPYRTQRQNHPQQVQEKAKYSHPNSDDSLFSSPAASGFTTRQWVALLLSYPLYGTLSFYLSLLPKAGNACEGHADGTSPKKVVYQPPTQAEVDYFLGEGTSKVVAAFLLDGPVEVEEEENEEPWVDTDVQKRSLAVGYFPLDGRHKNSSRSSSLLREASFSMAEMRWRSRIPSVVDAFLAPIFGIAPHQATSASSSLSSLEYGHLSLSEHLLLRLCYKERQRVDRYFNLFLEEQKKLEFFREDYLAHPPSPLTSQPPVRLSGAVSSVAEERYLSISPLKRKEERPSPNADHVKMKEQKRPVLTKGVNGELYPWCYDPLPPPTSHSPTSSQPSFTVMDGSAMPPNSSTVSLEERTNGNWRLTDSLLAPYREGEGRKKSRGMVVLPEASSASPAHHSTFLTDTAPGSLRRRLILLSPSGSERSNSNEIMKEVVRKDAASFVPLKNGHANDRSFPLAGVQKSGTSTVTTFSAPAEENRNGNTEKRTIGRRNDGEHCAPPHDSTDSVILPAWQCEVCFDGDGDLFRCSHCKGLRHEACGGPRPASSFSPSSQSYKGGEGKHTCAVSPASWSSEQDGNEKEGVKKNTVPSRSTLCRDCANAMQLSDEERSSSSSSLRSSTSTDERDELGSLLKDEDDDSSLSGFIVHTSDDDDDDSSTSKSMEEATYRKDQEQRKRSRRASNSQREDKKSSSSEEEEVESTTADDDVIVSKKKKKQRRQIDQVNVPVRCHQDPLRESSPEASRKKRKRLASHDHSVEKHKKRKTK